MVIQNFYNNQRFKGQFMTPTLISYATILHFSG